MALSLDVGPPPWWVIASWKGSFQPRPLSCLRHNQKSSYWHLSVFPLSWPCHLSSCCEVLYGHWLFPTLSAAITPEQRDMTWWFPTMILAEDFPGHEWIELPEVNALAALSYRNLVDKGQLPCHCGGVILKNILSHSPGPCPALTDISFVALSPPYGVISHRSTTSPIGDQL